MVPEGIKCESGAECVASNVRCGVCINRAVNPAAKFNSEVILMKTESSLSRAALLAAVSASAQNIQTNQFKVPVRVMVERRPCLPLTIVSSTPPTREKCACRPAPAVDLIR